jgi:wobble nucleotide-excising tRNase
MEYAAIFNGAITLIVGAFAFVIYFLQRSQNKRSAARAILSEIQNAEIAIESIQSSQKVGNTTSVLRTDYWTQYGHLLLEDFDFLEQRTITQFYNDCKLIQQRVEFLQQQESEQRTQAGFELQKKIVELCLSESNDNLLKSKIDKMTNRFHMQTYWFDQNAAKMSLLGILTSLRKISNTPVGEKLKELAGI